MSTSKQSRKPSPKKSPKMAHGGNAASGPARATKAVVAKASSIAARDRIEPRKPAQPEMHRDQHASAARGRNMPKPKSSAASKRRS
ncbi:MAG: hypothetical protein EPO68_14985 [Planctomycetota bacterium]|nr:MAG: hypothetical protein EPO68_14985 [Planctomycetota bacterium]